MEGQPAREPGGVGPGGEAGGRLRPGPGWGRVDRQRGRGHGASAGVRAGLMIHVAAKRHGCRWCRKPIEVGHPYWRTGVMDRRLGETTVFTIKTCHVCQTLGDSETPPLHLPAFVAWREPPD